MGGVERGGAADEVEDLVSGLVNVRQGEVGGPTVIPRHEGVGDHPVTLDVVGRFMLGVGVDDEHHAASHLRADVGEEVVEAWRVGEGHETAMDVDVALDDLGEVALSRRLVESLHRLEDPGDPGLVVASRVEDRRGFEEGPHAVEVTHVALGQRRDDHPVMHLVGDETLAREDP